MPLAQPLSAIPPKPLQWLWPRFIPKARLTLLAADPGTGKTALALDLASRLSQNLPLPPLPPEMDPANPLSPSPYPLSPPSATLLLTPDDKPADILRPRIDAMHANPNLIHFISVHPSHSPQPLFDALEENLPALLAKNLQLVIIDPITAYLPITTSSTPLYHLAQLADQYNVAFLLTTRLAKQFPTALSSHHIRRALGSLAYASAARCVHLLLPDRPNSLLRPKPADPASAPPLPPPERRLLIPIKSNCGPLPPPLAFSLAQTITWDAAPADDRFLRTDLMLQHAADFLLSFLADGPISANKVFDAGLKNGITRITLTRAKAALNIESAKHGMAGSWYWSLPGDTRTPATPPFDPTLPPLPDLSRLMSILASA